MTRKTPDLREIVASYDVYAGEFQVLEMRLKEYMADTAGTGVIVVLSTEQGEGKSVFAVHLSRALVRAGDKTLLIDGNPYNPSVSKLFSQGTTGGLSQLLASNVQDLTSEIISSTIHDSGEGYSVMPWGGEQNGSQLGGNPAGLFSHLKALGYTSIIVDGPPAGDEPFGLILAAKADAVLAVVASGRIPAKDLAKFKDRVDSTGTKLAGFVMNKFKFRKTRLK